MDIDMDSFSWIAAVAKRDGVSGTEAARRMLAYAGETMPEDWGKPARKPRRRPVRDRETKAA